MSKVIILIATMVIAVNLLYTMLPEGSYEKYCKYIFGLILILVFAGTVVKFDISSEVVNFYKNIPVFENTKIVETVQEQTEMLIRDNIINMLRSNRLKVDGINVSMENDQIAEIKVNLSDKGNKDEIISMISSFCDINKEIIVIE